MIRRILLASTCALVAATAVPSFAATPKCVTFTDAKGDGMAAQTAPAADPALDVVGVKFASTAKALVMTISLDKLAERPKYAPGNRVQATFTVLGKVVVVYYKFSPTRTQEAEVFYQQGIRVDGVFFSAAFEPSVKGNDVIMSVKFSELKAAVGGVVSGKKLTDLKGEALGSYVAQNLMWDTAAAPASASFTPGSACK